MILPVDISHGLFPTQVNKASTLEDDKSLYILI
jgi:hypothetical protein